MNPEDMSGGMGDAGAGHGLEAWVGQVVTAGMEFRKASDLIGTLESVDDRGIVLRQPSDTGEVPVFYP